MSFRYRTVEEYDRQITRLQHERASFIDASRLAALNLEIAPSEVAVREFGMFSVDGNKRVTTLVEQVRRWPYDDWNELVQAGLKRISERHGEVYDTDVRDRIFSELRRFYVAAGGDGFDFSLDI